MAKSTVGTFIKVALIVGIPVAALAWVSSASGNSGAGKPTGKPTSKPAEDLPKKIKAWADKWLSGPGSEPADGGPRPEHVGWFLYAGRWIMIEQYAEPAPEITEDTAWTMGPLAREYTYRARFRWTVMHSGAADSPPFGMGDATTSGVGQTLGPPYDSAIEAARKDAANNAANEAAAWIDSLNAGPKA